MKTPDSIDLMIALMLLCPVCLSISTPGTIAVTWELFPNIRLSWNDASKFCLTRGGHLPTPNTQLAHTALGETAAEWFGNWTGDSTKFKEFWIGLYSSQVNKVPNVWERDCSLQDPSVQPWDTFGSEPNYLDTSRCVRAYGGQQTGQAVWRTWPCQDVVTVVCEYQLGNCTSEIIQNKTLTSSEVGAYVTNISDATACWAACLELRVNDVECVATSWKEMTHTCEMELGTKLVNATAELFADDDADSVVWLRRCFGSAVNTVTSPTSTTTLASATPQSPAILACPTTFLIPAYDDVIPSDVTVLIHLQDTSNVTNGATELAANVTTMTTTGKLASEARDATTARTHSSTSLPTSFTVNDVTVSAHDASVLALILSTAQTTPNLTSKKLRPCLCRRPTSLSDVIGDDIKGKSDVILKTSTSRYKRSKISVSTGEPLHTGIGVAFVISSFAIVASFMCCDLCRLGNCQRKNRHTLRRAFN